MAQKSTTDPTLLAERWLGVVSHDLRNPLATIRIGVDILGIANLEPGLARLVSRMDDAAQRAQRLIEDLLDFTQARTGRSFPAARERMDLHECAADTLAEISLVFPDRNIEHVASGPGECTGDRHRLVQALGNLVTNAIAHGDPASPITVRSDKADGRCVLSVHNEGDTLSPEDLLTLFDPMVRVEQQWNRSRSLGLGLFIVREIAHAHAGEVTASSGENGTLFTIMFPAAI